MRLRHRGKRPVDRPRIEPQQRGFTPFECVRIYWLNRQGFTQQVLATNLDVAQGTISRAINRGRDTFHGWDVPYMRAVGADNECGHNKPIQVGEYIVCCRCFVSGWDDVEAMQVTSSDLALIERKEFEASLPKDKDGNPIYPQEPLKPFAERMHPPKPEKNKK